MTSLYNSRKQQLSGTPKIIMSDIGTEIEKARSSTPKPVPRSTSVEVKKIAYKQDLEDIKNKMNIVELSSKTLEQKFINLMEESKKELSSVVDDKMNENKKHMDSLKVEQLKNTLNDSIFKINEQLKNIASQLVHNIDIVSELKVKVDEIENMF